MNQRFSSLLRCWWSWFFSLWKWMFWIQWIVILIMTILCCSFWRYFKDHLTVRYRILRAYLIYECLWIHMCVKLWIRYSCTSKATWSSQRMPRVCFDLFHFCFKFTTHRYPKHMKVCGFDMFVLLSYYNDVQSWRYLTSLGPDKLKVICSFDNNIREHWEKIPFHNLPFP